MTVSGNSFIDVDSCGGLDWIENEIQANKAQNEMKEEEFNEIMFAVLTFFVIFSVLA